MEKGDQAIGVCSSNSVFRMLRDADIADYPPLEIAVFDEIIALALTSLASARTGRQSSGSWKGTVFTSNAGTVPGSRSGLKPARSNIFVASYTSLVRTAK
jgi:hypothetical protein